MEDAVAGSAGAERRPAAVHWGRGLIEEDLSDSIDFGIKGQGHRAGLPLAGACLRLHGSRRRRRVERRTKRATVVAVETFENETKRTYAHIVV